MQVLYKRTLGAKLVVMQTSIPQLKQNSRPFQSLFDFCMLLEDVKEEVHLQEPRTCAP